MMALPRKLAAVLVASACLVGSAGAAEPIKIGVAVGLSGANSTVAPSVVQASQLAVDAINAKGGVLGRTLQLVVVDDASGAAGAQKAFDALIYQNEVQAVIAMETSAARNAALPIVQRGKIPYIYTSFYEGASCHPNLFVNGWVPQQQVPPIVDYFVDEKKAKKFFLIGSDYAFGRGMLAFARKAIEAKGGTVVGEEYLPIDGTDWTPILSKLKASGAEALVTSTAGGAPNVTLTKQLRSSGIDLPYGNLAVDEGTARGMGADAAGIYLSASYVTGIETPANRAYLDALKAKFGDKFLTPNDLSTPQYEGILAYAAAVEKAGSTEVRPVLDALKTVSVAGPRGTIVMSRQHHAPLTMYLAQVQADGTVKVIRTFANVDPGNQCPKLD